MWPNKQANNFWLPFKLYKFCLTWRKGEVQERKKFQSKVKVGQNVHHDYLTLFNIMP